MPTRRRLSSLRSFGGDCGQRRHRASDAQLPGGTWMWAWRMCMRCEYGEDSADTSDDDVPTSTGSCACSRGCDGYASTPDSGFVQRSVLRSVCTESVFLPLPSLVCWRVPRSCCVHRNRPGKCKSRKAVSRLMLRLLAAGTLLVSSASGFALSSGSRHASVSSRRAVDAVVMKGAYDFSAKRLGTDATVNLSEFEGKVALIVNVASK